MFRKLFALTVIVAVLSIVSSFAAACPLGGCSNEASCGVSSEASCGVASGQQAKLGGRLKDFVDKLKSKLHARRGSRHESSCGEASCGVSSEASCAAPYSGD